MITGIRHSIHCWLHRKQALNHIVKLKYNKSKSASSNLYCQYSTGQHDLTSSGDI